MDDTLKIFKNDPIYLKSLIGKEIEVEMINNATYQGLVYCIDPVTENIVLVNKTDDKHYDTDLLLGYCVKNLKVVNNDVSTDIIFESQTREDVDMVDLSKKRGRVKDWLANHFIDVIEDGLELKIGDDLVIYPPYTVNNCISSNTIILERIGKILMKMYDGDEQS